MAPDRDALSSHPLAAGLTPSIVASLSDAARPFALPRGRTNAARGVVFVLRGLAAAMARTPDGGRAEAGLIGHGGLFGERAALGGGQFGPDIVAIADVAGFEIPARRLQELRALSPALASAVDRYVLRRLAEAERLCACAALHPVDRRMARWLARACAVSNERSIAITHDTLAAIFGVRRASVTTSLHVLEGEAALRCRRGHIEVRDVARLEALSCGCHRSLG